MNTKKLTLEILKSNRIESWFAFYKKYIVRDITKMPSEADSTGELIIEFKGIFYAITFQELYSSIFLELKDLLPSKEDVNVVWNSLSSSYRIEEAQKVFRKIVTISI